MRRTFLQTVIAPFNLRMLTSHLEYEPLVALLDPLHRSVTFTI